MKITISADLFTSLKRHQARSAFYINGWSYTYQELSESVEKIRPEVRQITGKGVGLVANDDLLTYASILAIWFEGKYYVPLNPDTPRDRNENVVEQAELKAILNSKSDVIVNNAKHILTSGLQTGMSSQPIAVPQPDDICYLLFTSGTTGVPKGVPITYRNLEGFLKAFDALDIQVDEHDRVLQMFELTFDLSVMSFLVPLTKGACVFTIPKNKIKYAFIYELMEEHELTVALMVPSIIRYLRSYFDEINCPKMRCSLFCGEALPLDVTLEWGRCIPNARILNVYGPTENTIFCTSYEVNNKSHKSHNGIVSIGRAMSGVETKIVDEDDAIVKPGEKGELCLAGALLTDGYWKNPKKDEECFFMLMSGSATKRFYRTGDLCFADKEGDIQYVGRKDSQVKIQGYRVELSEVEHYANQFLGNLRAVAVVVENRQLNSEIGLCIETENIDAKELLSLMGTKLPSYMIPTRIRTISAFPMNANGKTDRKKIAALFKATDEL